ncbi:hypothetical protein H6P81_006784 [Aristolochia fimbriata]|uniref:Mitogen-activated protein kinase-binding protein 1 n=1 Tax=Aristolochia fimbriata TaxID=158543 RepID=A0AAV7F0G7_ARIFI|nr:hypothetical protein H6P81_006784 [Aristolochia fimbriata]
MKPKPKRSDSASMLVLEKIIGLTTKNASGLASSMYTGNCVYVAGCVAVVYDLDSNTQSYLMVPSRPPKPLSCVAISRGAATYVAAGESGSQPAVLVWDYSTQTLLAELKGHRFGIACIDFSPDGKHLVSVGYPHDGYLCLWDWVSQRVVTKLKVSASWSAISSVKFSSDGVYLLTAGRKHLKYWALGCSARVRANAGTVLQATEGKAPNLGCRKGDSFVSIAFAASSTSNSEWKDRTTDIGFVYALTDGGILCVLNSGFSLRRSVDLKVDKGFALSMSIKVVACCCSSGIVQLVAIDTLKLTGSLQYSELVKNNSPGMNISVPIPDAIACQFSTSEKLVVVYGDHSLYLWDVSDAPKVVHSCLLITHSACIWDVTNLPCKNMHNPALLCVARGFCREVSFATCSEDGTIRVWDFELPTDTKKDNTKSEAFVGNPPDICSNSEHNDQLQLVSSALFDAEVVESSLETKGIRSLAASLEGRYLAAGDCQGNIHVYNLNTYNYTCFQEAHASEILSLSFSSNGQKIGVATQEFKNLHLLASGGRDHVIHVYDVKRDCHPIGSFEDHSGAVTSVKFTHNGSKVLSSSVDRSVLLRVVEVTNDQLKILHDHSLQIVTHAPIYDMAIEPVSQSVVTVGQDKKMNVFDFGAGKFIKAFKQDPDCGEPIKISIDPSGGYVVCSYSNKSLGIYDIDTGKLITQSMGHSEVVTGVIFLPDHKHIISVGGDGCIFIWKMPALLMSKMTHSAVNQAVPLTSSTSEVMVMSEADNNQEMLANGKDHGETPLFKFSVSKLPKWAQNKLCRENIVKREDDTVLTEVTDNTPDFLRTSKYDTPFCAKSGVNDVSQSGTTASSTSDAGEVSHLDDQIPRIDVEGRWNTIHNVCLDLFDSPNLRDFKDFGSSVVAPIPLEVPGDQPPNGEYNRKIMDSGSYDQYQGEDIFSQHFCSLSTVQKVQRRGVSKRRSFSGHFVMRRDCLVGSRRHSEIRTSGGEIRRYPGEDAPKSSFGNLSTLFANESELSDICEKGDENSVRSMFVPSTLQSDLVAADGSLVEVRDGRTLEEIKVQDKIDQCKTALLSLDAAAEKTLQLFRDIEVLKRPGEVSNLVGAELYNIASNTIPLILSKVHRLSDICIQERLS